MRNYVDRRTGRYIHTRLQDATSSVWACTPYIDTNYLKLLIELAESGLDVRLISSNQQTGFYLKDYIEKRANIPKSFKHLILTGSDYVHAKLYIIDGNYAVDGSVNLTGNSLWNQPNYIHIHESEQEVHVVEDTFKRIWNYNADQGSRKSTPLARKPAGVSPP